MRFLYRYDIRVYMITKWKTTFLSQSDNSTEVHFPESGSGFRFLMVERILWTGVIGLELLLIPFLFIRKMESFHWKAILLAKILKLRHLLTIWKKFTFRSEFAFRFLVGDGCSLQLGVIDLELLTFYWMWANQIRERCGLRAKFKKMSAECSFLIKRLERARTCTHFVSDTFRKMKGDFMRIQRCGTFHGEWYSSKKRWFCIILADARIVDATLKLQDHQNNISTEIKLFRDDIRERISTYHMEPCQ